MPTTPPLGGAPALSPVTRPSTVDLITRELRNAIFSGALRVGSPIREVEMAGQLGVSRGPFREAAQRLVAEGLVVATPGRGLSVRTIGADRVRPLYAARTTVEVTAGRLAVAHATDAQVAEVRAAHDALVAADTTRDALRIGDADLNVHWALVAASANPWLLRWMTTLIVEVRIASFTVAEEYAVRRDSAESHAGIVERLEARDADGLEAAIRANLDAAVTRLLAPEAADVETLEEPLPLPAPRLDPLDL
ncbi:GntR family transcriptional regulator [Isoptericola dokdonensis]|jgi:DNA-binding GntR family transcriptional regulator|uniref:Putative HTH-type transcriptional regulator YdfH n=1 Tax=Isoptericola dokdonensis DS-3 TaxID=1300344 RepID=A0A168FWQ6_9MICO|nr:GntR family transcriptional regulator [Isoptericola dokdonensis]ANC32631.1 putative HTH-type transcriptional regulator YdfH [Isoptericola dokdonensis DS-3]